MSKKQVIVALSTCKSEYVATTSCICHFVAKSTKWIELALQEKVNY